LPDVGFSEILLILVIALVVIGPKRLPEAARFLGYWTGRLRRALQHARADMERELGIDDIKREVHNQLRMEELEAERRQVAETFRRTQSQPPAPLPAAPPADPATMDFIDNEPPAADARPAPPAEAAAAKRPPP
jgi:sec-independent protein translocase protein TatB